MDGAGWEPNDSKRAAKAHAEAVAKAQANPKAPPWGKVWGRVDIDRGRFAQQIAPKKWAAVSATEYAPSKPLTPRPRKRREVGFLVPFYERGRQRSRQDNAPRQSDITGTLRFHSSAG
jgi:hypothetical protein